VLGVYDPRLLEPLARVLGMLGAERAWTVHGEGLDEMTVTGPTQVVEWRDGGVRLFKITPEAVGLSRAPIEDLRGGGPAENARALSDLLDGRAGAYRDIVLLNAAAAFLVADAVETLREGVERAAASIDEGRARAALDRLVEGHEWLTSSSGSPPTSARTWRDGSPARPWPNWSAGPPRPIRPAASAQPSSRRRRPAALPS
jgi:anthranilate phosphoribosyltransferase